MNASYEAIFPSLRTVPPAYPPPPEWQSTAPGSSASGDDDFAHDMMEILNPLQHIPIVSTIYRQLTGDKIGPMERIAGDTLYGGLLGLASSVANVVFQQVTGKDFGDTALAMLGMGDDKQTAVAANDAAAQPATTHVASPEPAQLIPVAGNTNSQTQGQPGAASTVDGAGSVLMNSLNRNGIGLDLGSTVASIAPLPSTTADTGSLSDTNANALMASLSRDGVGTDMGLRAMYAYRKSLDLPASVATANATQH